MELTSIDQLAPGPVSFDVTQHAPGMSVEPRAAASVPEGQDLRPNADLCPQRLQSLAWIRRSEHRVAGNEHVGTRLGGSPRGAGPDAAVDPDPIAMSFALAQRTSLAHLRQHVGHERLAAESRFNGHDEQHVDAAEPRSSLLERCGGLDRKP